MKIKMTGRNWATSAHKRAMRKLVRHAVSHYPKDHALHSAVSSALDATCSGKAKAGKRMKRKTSRRRAPARRRMMRTPMRRRAMRGRTMRRTARRMRRRA
jgi:hypothetical protein